MKSSLLIYLGILFLCLAGSINADDDFDLSDYPHLFISDGIFNAYFVLDDNAPSRDVIAAIDLAAAIANEEDVEIPPIKLLSEIEDFYKINMILISSDCSLVNCEDIFENERQSKIWLYTKGDIYWLYVFAQDEETLDAAVDVLIHHEDYNLKGYEVLIDTEGSRKEVTLLDYGEVYITDTLEEGDEKKYYLEGKEYEVEILDVNEYEADLTLNGRLVENLEEGDGIFWNGFEMEILNIEEGEVTFILYFTYEEAVETDIAVEKLEPSDMRLDRISMNDITVAGEELTASINLENEFDEDLEDVSITIMIPELGIRQKAGPFDLDNELSKRISLDIPADTPKGIYTVRITASNDDIRRVIHREILIE